MIVRFLSIPVAMTLLLLFISYMPYTGPLRAVTADKQVVLSTDDVEEIYLKYSRDDERYIASIELSARGRDRMAELLEGQAGGEMLMYLGDIFLARLPVMTDRIDRLLIKIDDQQSAIDLLKDLSDSSG